MMQQLNKKLRESNLGFSLMELMVVIAIIGILAGISIRLFNKPEHKVKKAIMGLFGDMSRTRAAAVKDNSEWAIAFDLPNDRYYVCSDPGVDNDWTTLFGANGNTIVKTVNFDHHLTGLEIGGTTFGANDIVFNPDGSCEQGNISLTYSGISYRVATLNNGSIRVERFSNGAWQGW